MSSILQAFEGEGGLPWGRRRGKCKVFVSKHIEWKVAWINLHHLRSKIICRPWTDRESCGSKRSNSSLICRRGLTDFKPTCDDVTSDPTNPTGGRSAQEMLAMRIFFISAYGSVSAGREKWPFNVIFFKVEPPCDQTWWDSLVCSILSCFSYVVHAENTLVGPVGPF